MEVVPGTQPFAKMAKLLEYCGGNIIESVNGVWFINLSPMLHRQLSKMGVRLAPTARFDSMNNEEVSHLIRQLQKIASE